MEEKSEEISYYKEDNVVVYKEDDGSFEAQDYNKVHEHHGFKAPCNKMGYIRYIKNDESCEHGICKALHEIPVINGFHSLIFPGSCLPN